MSTKEVWLHFPDARQTIAEKISDPELVTSIFLYSLREGLIVARCREIRPVVTREPEREDILSLVDNEGYISREAWSESSLEGKRSDPKRGIFSIASPWGHALATLHDVEFRQREMRNLITRKGIGGAPFKKVHWLRMTSVLIKLALDNDFEQFESFADFLSYLDDEINKNGEALDTSSIRGPAEQIWRQISDHRNRFSD